MDKKYTKKTDITKAKTFVNTFRSVGCLNVLNDGS